mgnify:CR=1 FL=1
MTDWFKVQMNEADRRITMEVHLKSLIEAVEAGDPTMIEFAAQLAKEALEENFDKYEDAEEA